MWVFSFWEPQDKLGAALPVELCLSNPLRGSGVGRSVISKAPGEKTPELVFAFRVWKMLFTPW